MIDSFYPKEEDGGSCRSTGCSCCSCEYDIKRDKETILKEARDNVRVAKEICEFYKVPFSKFSKDILTEKKCKDHQWYAKYKDQLVCWKCGKWGEKIKND